MSRQTYQKEVIMDALVFLKGKHPTADTIYDRVRLSIPSISRATVYRILNNLSKKNVLLRVSFPAGADIYDINPVPHYHLRCRNCGAIIDIDIPVKDITEIFSTGNDRYIITGCDILFNGYCAECKKENNGS